VFTNSGGAPVHSILINHVFDRLCGHEPAPWLDRLRDLRRKALAQQETDEQTQKTARKTNTKPSHELADYTGNYDHPAYGRMTLTRNGNGLQWSWRGMSAPLSHRHYDTFDLPRLPYELNPDRLAISFTTDRDGNIASLSAQLEPMVADIVFKRAPAVIRPLVIWKVRGKVRNNLHAHGIGRHTEAEMTSMSNRAFEALSLLLGENRYLMGNEPCGADATAFAFIAGSLCPLFESPAHAKARTLPNLIAYRDRMMVEFYPDMATKMGTLPIS